MHVCIVAELTHPDNIIEIDIVNQTAELSHSYKIIYSDIMNKIKHKFP